MDSALILASLKRQLVRLEKDLRAQAGADPAAGARLKALYADASAKHRTASTYSAWLDETVTQVGAHWLLGCVFLRFLEDNGLVASPWLSGAGDRLQQARDAHTLYFRQPDFGVHSDTDYLAHCFAKAARLPGLDAFFRPEHNPLFLLRPGGDAGTELVRLFQETEPDTGALRLDFTSPGLDTRFLGDLYQDLSEAARKRFALLQTPVFIEEFILDRTLEPAIRDFGLATARLIDPTCGSGHFLLGAFARLFAKWQFQEPGANPRVLAERALDQVYGVDLNPFAVAIARFRLLVAALQACGIRLLKDAPDFAIHVAAGDSLLHGVSFATQRSFVGDPAFDDSFDSVLDTEDAVELRRILGQQFHAVVGNPPYIIVKDKDLNQEYRKRWNSCSGKYSLAVPFFERFFRLAVDGNAAEKRAAGYVGMITANSFMKREFGGKLVEEFIPRWDLTHVIDTAGAYIPGHGTPTVIVFGKNQAYVAPTIRTVMGIAGEPSTPDNPAHGVVWSAIVSQVDQPGSVSDWVSVADSPRENFHKHPWSIGGGGAAELKDGIEDSCSKTLVEFAEISRKRPVIGFGAILGEDDAYSCFAGRLPIRRIPEPYRRPLIEGDQLRDWSETWLSEVVFPYDSEIRLVADTCIQNYLWPLRSTLEGRLDFSKETYRECGRPFWEYHQIPIERNQAKRPLSIVFAFVATHNHFVLDRGQKVFKQSAPLIKLKPELRVEDHLELIGLLNSSIACFWLKQVAHNKGSTVDTKGARQRTAAFEDFYEFTAAQVAEFPVAEEKPLALATELDRLAQELQRHSPAAVLAEGGPFTRERLDAARAASATTLGRMIALQEELDWFCYRSYGLIEEDLTCPPESVPEIRFGERAFEVLLARELAEGSVSTTWFARHNAEPITKLPPEWPAAYRRVVARRMETILGKAAEEEALTETQRHREEKAENSRCSSFSSSVSPCLRASVRKIPLPICVNLRNLRINLPRSGRGTSASSNAPNTSAAGIWSRGTPRKSGRCATFSSIFSKAARSGRNRN